MTWSRRELLRHVGAAAGTALVAAGCGGASNARRLERALTLDAVTRAVEAATAELAGRWPSARVLARAHLHAAAATDVLGPTAAQQQHATAVLSISSASGELVEHVSTGLGEAELVAAARALAAEATRRKLGSGAPAPPPAPLAVGGEPTPRLWGAPAMAAHVATLAEAADRLGSSRIIYRGAGVDVDVTTSWIGTAAGVTRHHQVRQRSAVALVAFHGAAPRGCEVFVGQTSPPGTAALAAGPSAEALAAAAERLLRLSTPAPLEAGVAEVVLAPSLVSCLCHALAAALPTAGAATLGGLARAAEAARVRWQLRSAPEVPGAYGGYLVDDRGQPARGQALLAAPPEPPQEAGDEVAPAPRHLALVAPTTELSGALERGFWLEDGEGAYVDLRGDRVVLRARTALELAGGAATGRAFAGVAARARLSELLASFGGFGVPELTRCERHERAGVPTFASAEMPAALARVELLPRGVR